MTVASDGSLWVTEEAIGAIARIDKAGHIRQYRIPGSSNDPDGILQGPDGRIWFAGFEVIGQVNTSGPMTGWEDGTGTTSPIFPDALTLGPGDAVWYTNGSDTTAGIGRVSDAQAPMIVAALPKSNFNFPARGIAAGPGNAVWFSEIYEGYGKDAIGKVTASGQYTQWALPAATDPQSITAGPDHAMWFTERTGIGRITPSGTITNFAFQSGGRPDDVISGSDGALWFTTKTRVGRITPAGRINSWSVPGAKSLSSIAIAADGSYWLADDKTSVIRRFKPPQSLLHSGVQSDTPAPPAATGPKADPPCNAAEFLRIVSRGNSAQYAWGPLRYACAGGWAIVAGKSKLVGAGIAFLQATPSGWHSTGLEDGSCMAATSKRQCPYPPQFGVPPHALLLYLVRKAGLLIDAHGNIALPS